LGGLLAGLVCSFVSYHVLFGLFYGSRREGEGFLFLIYVLPLNLVLCPIIGLITGLITGSLIRSRGGAIAGGFLVSSLLSAGLMVWIFVR
jgi:hypothetical protein